MVALHFVLPTGLNCATCSEDLAEAFQQCKHRELNPEWIDEKEVSSLSPKKTDVFVFQSFDGPAFDHVASLLTKKHAPTIIGPLCLIGCFLTNSNVPDLPQPVWCLAMRDAIITSTGFDATEREQMERRIQRMGGVYSNNLHCGVTHVVAKVLKSRKCEVASERDLPVLMPDWISDVWSTVNSGLSIDKRAAVDASAPVFLNKFRCPPLYGFVIAVSQVAECEKQRLKKAMEAHGAIYSPILEMHRTHVLISPVASGKKYDHAVRWKIACVRPDWLLDSIEKGQCLPSQNYRLDATSKSSVDESASSVTDPPANAVRVSTPEKCSNMTAVNLLRASDGQMDSSAIVSTSASSRRKNYNTYDASSVIQVDDTCADRSRFSDAPSLLFDGPARPYRPPLIGSASGSDFGAKWPSSRIVDELNKVSISRTKSTCLDGCRIYLASDQCDNSVIGHVGTFVESCGGIRIRQLVDTATHVVVLQSLTSDERNLIDRLGKTKMVTWPWLMHCTQVGRACNEADFRYWSPSQTSSVAAETTVLRLTKPAVQAERSTLVDTAATAADEDNNDGEDDIMAKYGLAQNAESSCQPRRVAENDSTDFPTMQDSTETQICRFFTGMAFAMVSDEFNTYESEDAQGAADSGSFDYCAELSDWIVEAGGKIVRTASADELIEGGDVVDVDYVVTSYKFIYSISGCPIFERLSRLSRMALVTDLFIEDCLDEGKRVEPPKPIFHVCRATKINSLRHDGATRQFVICVSGFSGRHRRFVVHLAEVVGLTVQEAFVRRENKAKGQLQSTHLVCDPSVVLADDAGSVKYKAALKWQLPAISVDWLMACAVSGFLVSERPFLVGESDCFDPDMPVVELGTESGRRSFLMPLDSLMSTPVAASTRKDCPESTAIDTPGPQLDWNSLRPRRVEVDDLPDTQEDTMLLNRDLEDSMDSGAEKVRAHHTNSAACQTPVRDETSCSPLEALRECMASVERRVAAREARRRQAEADQWQSLVDTLTKMHDKLLKTGESDSPSRKRKASTGLDERFRHLKLQNQGGKSRPAEQSAKTAKLQISPEQQESEDGPLSGLIIYITSNCQSIKDKLVQLIRQLGGKIVHSNPWTSNVTHIIDRIERTSSTDLVKRTSPDNRWHWVRTARRMTPVVHVVAPDWLIDSEEKGVRAVEYLYPPEHDAKMSLASSMAVRKLAPTKTRPVLDLAQADPQVASEDSPGDLTLLTKSAKAVRKKRIIVDDGDDDSFSHPNENNAASQEDSLDKLLAVMSSTTKSSTILSTRRRSNVAKISTDKVQENCPNVLNFDDAGDDFDDVTNVGSGGIAWEDEAETEMRNKLLDDGNEFPVKDGVRVMADSDKRDAKFMVHGLSDEVRSQFAALLSKNSIEMFVTPSASDMLAATHLVSATMSRSEKMLTAISGGKWILHPDYVAECLNAEELLAVDKFEWGDSSNQYLDSLKPDNDSDYQSRSWIGYRLAKASHVWRSRLTSSTTGPFSGFTVHLSVPESKRIAFANMINVGGGSVVNNLTNAALTHAIAQPNLAGGLDLVTLARQGVPVVQPTYLCEFLMSIADDSPTPVDAFLLEDFKPYWNCQRN